MLNPFQPFFYLLAYLAILYIRPHEFVPAFMNLPVLPLLLVAAFGIWLVRQPKNFEASQFRLMPVLLLMLMLSVIFTGWFGGGLQVFSDFAPVVMLFYIVATSVDSLQRLRQIFIVLSVSVTVIAWHGIDQSARGIGWTGAELSQGTRITYLGFLNDPNDLAMALTMVLPMIVYLARGAGSRLVGLAWYAAAAAVMYAIYLTNSRGAVLAVGSMVAMYGMLRYGVVKSVIVLPMLMAPLVALGPSRMAEMSADEDSAEGRIEAWYEGVQLLISRPLFGVGKGQFAEHHGLTAHNSFVLAFAELGLIGYFFWLSILIISWLMLQRLVRSGHEPAPAPAPDSAAASGIEQTAEEVLPADSGPHEDTLGEDASDESALDDDDKKKGKPEETPWEKLQGAARTLWYGYVGGLVSAFFLSRSYVVILYLHIALIVAVFQMARRERPDFAPVLFGPMAGRLALVSLGSVIGLWILTRVLLAFT